MSDQRASSFDRVRPRRGQPTVPAPGPIGVDAQGKRALFSTDPAVPALGSVTVECARCGETSVLSLAQAVRAAVPSVHLPLLRRHSSYLRCPACARWSWVRVGIRL